MRRKILCLVMVLVFIFSGCGNDNSEEVTTTEATVTQPYYLKENVSEYAHKNYLDFDNSSWEREYKPEYVMVHFMSGVTVDKMNPYDDELIRSVFTDYEIGINYIVKRDGTVECYLPENRAAWHAGEGEWNNDPKYTNLMNKYSIGIEVLAIGSESDMAQYLSAGEYASINPDDIGYTKEQYESLKLLIEDICKRYKIKFDRDHIIGHEEYSPDKTDPGELFDWSKIGLYE